MAAPHEISGTLTIFGAAPTPATVTLTALGPGKRVVRALQAFLTCWAAAIAAVFIPVAHFVLVPGLAILGMVLAVFRAREAKSILWIHGPCPRCGREEDFVPTGSPRGRLTVDCPGCFNQLFVTIGEGAPARAERVESVYR
jgi:hypothetical protein